MSPTAIYFTAENAPILHISRVLGPYHPDEIFAQQRAKHLLGHLDGNTVWRIEATSYEQARRKAATLLDKERRTRQTPHLRTT